MKRAYGIATGLAAALAWLAAGATEPAGYVFDDGSMEEIVVTAPAPARSSADEDTAPALVPAVIEVDLEGLLKDALSVRPEVEFAL